ncbi:phenylalanine 4-monooxygenase [Colwellia sp. UCD-KL20]|uniref:phenylalanine 4-monooxygenase n=1 Tax=Colwellia sp. UCD-KL20 TaxID=1917165 RepID=UPI000970916C|nr:phenylalanine 4-monooxygenase [Colwellia sp. UCD-KL20]
MAKSTKYISRTANENGFIDWSEEENAIWNELITRQLKVVEGVACNEFTQGLKLLNLPLERIPQLSDVSKVLKNTTDWQCEPVNALIGFGEFFKLLSERKFPVATFIRTREEFDYLQEPDIFHEIFGHCPLLTNPSFADYTQAYGKMGLNATKEQRVFLARLYWFTVEFGLLDTPEGIKLYGGGVLSSPKETQHAVFSNKAKRVPLNILDVLRTPYKIDIIQPIYYTLKKVSNLDDIRKHEVCEIMSFVEEAKLLGLHNPMY